MSLVNFNNENVLKKDFSLTLRERELGKKHVHHHSNKQSRQILETKIENNNEKFVHFTRHKVNIKSVT